MKILFTVYKEVYETEERILLFSKTIVTNIEIEEIDSILQLYDGFHSVLEVGNNLAFWDIYCYFADAQEIINRINSIPTTQMYKVSGKDPKVLLFEEFNPGNADAPCYPDRSKCFIYRITRYECGASGFETLIIWASSHPWLMVFIGGVVWDITKYLTVKIGEWIGAIKGNSTNRKTAKRSKRAVYLNIARFYRNFSKMENISYVDCQIVFLKRVRGGNFEVHVRTALNEYYVVKCNCHGKISSLNLEDAGKDEIDIT